jgi:hypothetical protein
MHTCLEHKVQSYWNFMFAECMISFLEFSVCQFCIHRHSDDSSDDC